MVATLPRNIQLKLDQTLNQWRQWRCDTPLSAAPVVIGTLGGGISNYSILVEAGERFVVRIDAIPPASNGLSRSTEWRALHAANEAELAPCPRYFNPDIGVLVCDYLPPDTTASYDLDKTAKLLRDIHGLPATHYRLDLRERITRYEHQIERHGDRSDAVLIPSRDQILRLLGELEASNEALVLCHNDLLSANRIASGGRLWAIDWEYCAMGSQWFDVAVVIVGDALDNAERAHLVKTYLGRMPTAQETLTLAKYCSVYKYLEQLWYLANRV